MYCETRKIIFILKSKRNGLRTVNVTKFDITKLSKAQLWRAVHTKPPIQKYLFHGH